jgi:hypothetical protein
MVTDTEVFNRNLSIIYGQTDHFVEQGLKILNQEMTKKTTSLDFSRGRIDLLMPERVGWIGQGGFYGLIAHRKKGYE